MPDRIILESPRLQLVMWDEADAPLIQSLHSTVETTRYLSGGTPWSLEKSEGHLKAWFNEQTCDGCTKYKMLARDDDRFIGLAGFSLSSGDPREFVLGYSVQRQERGNGYATEIARALSVWFFAQRLAPRFIAFTHPQNIASLRVLEKIGMRSRMPITIDGVSCPAFEMSR